MGWVSELSEGSIGGGWVGDPQSPASNPTANRTGPSSRAKATVSSAWASWLTLQGVRLMEGWPGRKWGEQKLSSVLKETAPKCLGHPNT